jgi:sulfur carrier protein ThiS
MSVADAVNAVVQNQLDEGTAASYAQMNGLMPEMFPILLETAGEPLSRTEMEQLYNRGLVDEADVEQALSESRLKNKYNGLAFDLHTRLPDMSMLSDAIVYGALDEDTALGKAMELGLAEDDAVIAVNSASNAKMFAYRSKVMEEIVSLYETNVIDNTTANQLITQLGFSGTQAAVILEGALYNANKRIQSAAINAIRAKYITHHITLDVANADLQAIGVSSAQMLNLTNMWQIEQSADVRLMTPMDVAKAYAAGLMDQDDATQYLENQGYSAADAAILIQVAS